MKMREALKRVKSELPGLISMLRSGANPKVVAMALDHILHDAEVALAESPRNCDVGDPDEQETRFCEFCDSNKVIDDMTGSDVCYGSCPAIGDGMGGCAFRWMQLPYESEEGGSE